MYAKISSFTLKSVYLAFILSLLLVPLHSAFAQDSEGIPIQKDVFLSGSILSVEDLPDQVTVALYDSANAAVPIATQTFQRGNYTLDFEFSKSDGMALGPVARLKVDFTNKLDMGDDPDNPTRVKEIWSEVALNGQPVGDRTQVSGETMVKLLLASDASVSTYLTLVYEGDDNPITTIYRDLPLASSSGTSANEYITSLFSASSPEDKVFGSLTSPYWELSGTNINYPDGNVGIGTSTPDRDLIVKYSSSQGALPLLPAITVANTNTTPGQFSFASFEFSGANDGVVGQFFADGSGFFYNGTPNVYFRASTDSPMLLGTNNLVRMVISNTGNVGIGLGTTVPTNKLDVYGTIRCTELIVTNTWSDFVFEDNYKLLALDEVEDFISKNKHLPGIPSEAEVKEKGVSVGSISSKLLQKIEELTLYVIDLKKENDLLKGQLTGIQAQLDNVAK